MVRLTGLESDGSKLAWTCTSPSFGGVIFHRASLLVCQDEARWFPLEYAFFVTP